MRKPNNISVIFVNYNSKKELERAIDSLKNFYDESLEVIIYNNSLYENLSSLKEIYKSAKILNSIKNVGFTAGCNKAVKVSNGEYLLFLNPDVEVINEFLSSGIDFFSDNKDFGAVGFKILNPDRTVQKECLRNIPTPINTFLRFFNLDKIFPSSKPYYSLDYEKPQEAHVLSGACMLVRKEAFLDVGGFDDKFFLYGDDIDLCIRLKDRGWKLYYLPIESVIHYKGGSLEKFSIKRIYYSHRAMFLFVKKYYKNPILLLLLYTGISIRFLVFLFISVFFSLFKLSFSSKS